MGLREGLRTLLAAPGGRAPRTLGGFFEGLVQTFENCRDGLSDEQARAGGADVERFFTRLYERELPQLVNALELHESQLTPQARGHLGTEVDERVRGVVIPAYARLAAPLTARERNDFYLTAPPLHVLERLGLAAAGMLIGAFVVWAPFIPIWSKELIFVFGLGGLLFPELRRVLALRRYQSALNRLVARTDGDVARLELALFTGEVVLGAAAQQVQDDDRSEEAAAAQPAATETTVKRRTTVRQGGL